MLDVGKSIKEEFTEVGKLEKKRLIKIFVSVYIMLTCLSMQL